MLSSWSIEVNHSCYYRWMPVNTEDLAVDKNGEFIEKAILVAATWPGFHLRRTIVQEPTTTTTSVHVPSLRATNVERRAAGLGPRSDATNLIKHLEDGPWPKHFPLESITAIRCNDPKIEARLIAHFLDT